MECGHQHSTRRTRTEGITEEAPAVFSSNTLEDINRYKYDVYLWTSLHTTMRLPALLDTQCAPNMIREDLAHAAGLRIESYPGDSLSQIDGTFYQPSGQVTTRIHFRGGSRTFDINFLLGPPNAQYDVLVGGNFISRNRLLIHNPAGFFLTFARETPGKFTANNLQSQLKPSTQNKRLSVSADNKRRKDGMPRLKERELKNDVGNAREIQLKNSAVKEREITGRQRLLPDVGDLTYQHYIQCSNALAA